MSTIYKCDRCDGTIPAPYGGIMKITMSPTLGPGGNPMPPAPMQETKDFCKKCIGEVWDWALTKDTTKVKTDGIVNKGKE